MARVHIIGAGISGLSAATALAEKHIPVTVYEASPHAGGRCRTSRESLDHGLHIVEARDKALAQYLARIGSGDSLAPAAPLPLPAAPLMDYLPWLRWLARPHGAANDLIARESQLRDAWFAPLSRLAFATPPKELPARSLRPALLRRLRPRPRMARDSLDASFVSPALDYLEQCGASVYFGHALQRCERVEGRISTLVFARKKQMVDADDIIILATPPGFAQTLIPGLSFDGQPHPAITLHFTCDHREAEGVAYPLTPPIDLIRYREGSISAAIRLADGQWHADPALFAARIWQLIRTRHPYLPITTPPVRQWREKRASHAVREGTRVPMDHGQLLLAGDWLDPTKPATLEAAAASGHAAAALAMERLPKRVQKKQQQFYLNSRI